MKTALFVGLACASLLSAQETREIIRIPDAGPPGPNVQTFEFLGGQILGGKPVKGVPYSAEAVTTMTQTLADGSHIVNTSSSTIYRDSEGRERREESIGKLGAWNAQGAPAKAVFISDPVANVSYSLDANTRTARRMPMPGQTFAWTNGPNFHGAMITGGPAPGSGNVVFYSRSVTGGGSDPAPKVEHLGAATIEGVQAEGTRTTVTIPAGQIGNERDLNIVSERWYSPELQVVVMSKHSDPRMGETVYKLTDINRAEPQPSLFQVPSDYTVTDMRVPAPPDLPKKPGQ